VHKVRHLAVGLAATRHALDRELAALAVVGPGEAVLPRLAGAVGHEHLNGQILAGQRGPHGPVVDPLDPERHDVIGLAELSSTLYCRQTISGRTPRALHRPRSMLVSANANTQ
jgi:hypothetical protein